MIFVKPEDVRYVDMCIWVDENAYTDNCDDEKLFEYLYHLAVMLAHKGKFFKKSKDYEDFAIYMASQTYFRLKNPKQFQLKADGSYRMKKVKSVLNYMKSTIYPRKVDFQQQYYTQTNVITDSTDYSTEYSFADKLTNSIDALTAKEFELCLDDVVQTCKAVISSIPHEKSTAEWYNIYVSCLLTFLNSITLTNFDINRIRKYSKNTSNKLDSLVSLYKEESNQPPILFHLDENMSDYIMVLVRKMKRAIAGDLSHNLHTYIPSNQGMELLALSNLNGSISYEENTYYED